MTTLKDGTTRTEIGQLNMISVAMEDLLEAERATLEKELQEEMATARRRKLMFPKNMHRGDQEGRTNHHDYRAYDYNIQANS
jgi:hypothetical protein